MTLCPVSSISEFSCPYIVIFPLLTQEKCLMCWYHIFVIHGLHDFPFKLLGRKVHEKSKECQFIVFMIVKFFMITTDCNCH